MHISLRGYLFFILVFMLGIVGQWTDESLQHLWRYPAAAIIIAFLFEAYQAKRLALKIQRELPASGILGRSVHGKISIHNGSGLPLRVRLYQTPPQGAAGQSPIHEFNLASNGKQSEVFSLVPQTLNTLTWDRIYTRIQGFFGLAWWNRNLRLPDTLPIIPDHLHREERDIGLKQSGDYQKLRAGSGSELLFLRDYRPGDSLRAIDWKATARSGRHVVRVFTEEQHLNVVFVVDAGRTSTIQAGALDRYHHYVNICARLAEQAITHNDLIGLVVFADQPLISLPPARGNPALVKLRHALAQTQPMLRESNPLAAASEIQRWLRHRSLVVLLTDLDTSDVSSQIVNTVKLLSPKHLPLIATLEEPQLGALAEKPAKHIMDPYNSLAAMEMTHLIRSTVLRLQRLGACVVRDKAEQLDDSVLRFYEQLRRRRRV